MRSSGPSQRDLAELPDWVWGARGGLAIGALITCVTNSLTAMNLQNPVLFVSIPVNIVFFFFIIRKSSFRITIEMMLYFDMLLVASLYFFGNLEHFYVHLSILGTGVIYLIVSLMFVRKLRASLILSAYFAIPLATVWFQPVTSMQRGLVIANSIFAAFVTLFFHLSRAGEEKETERRMRALTQKAEKAKSEMELGRVSEALLVHDARNLLQRLSLVELEHRQGRASAECARVASEVQKKLLPTLDLLSDLSRTTVRLREFVVTHLAEMAMVSLSLDIHPDVVIEFNPRLLRSILVNIARNAREAKQGGFVRLSVSWKAPVLGIQDDAGGFSVENLKEGQTAKPNGQGRFLLTLLRYQSSMGLSVGIRTVHGGTRFDLQFLDEGKGES